MNKIVLVFVGIASLLILVLGVGLLSGSRGSVENGQVAGTNQAAGRIANTENDKPDFELPHYDGSGNVKLSDAYRDKPTVVQFWATWCHVCREEFPENNKVAKKYTDQINYLAVDWGQGNTKAVQSYIDELGLDTGVITFLMDKSGAVGRSFGMRGTPLYLFIKKGGEVSKVYPGGIGAVVFEQSIQDILGG